MLISNESNPSMMFQIFNQLEGEEEKIDFMLWSIDVNPDIFDNYFCQKVIYLNELFRLR